jgi:hypothetical protein
MTLGWLTYPVFNMTKRPCQSYLKNETVRAMTFEPGLHISNLQVTFIKLSQIYNLKTNLSVLKELFNSKNKTTMGTLTISHVCLKTWLFKENFCHAKPIGKATLSAIQLMRKFLNSNQKIKNVWQFQIHSTVKVSPLLILRSATVTVVWLMQSDEFNDRD